MISEVMSSVQAPGSPGRFLAGSARYILRDLPCDLGLFVAERHNMPLTEAEGLIQRWVAEYEHQPAPR